MNDEIPSLKLTLVGDGGVGKVFLLNYSLRKLKNFQI
jgi:GTPase SAR1 family protein